MRRGPPGATRPSRTRRGLRPAKAVDDMSKRPARVLHRSRGPPVDTPRSFEDEFWEVKVRRRGSPRPGGWAQRRLADTHSNRSTASSREPKRATRGMLSVSSTTAERPVRLDPRTMRLREALKAPHDSHTSAASRTISSTEPAAPSSPPSPLPPPNVVGNPDPAWSSTTWRRRLPCTALCAHVFSRRGDVRSVFGSGRVPGTQTALKLRRISAERVSAAARSDLDIYSSAARRFIAPSRR